MEGHIMLIDRKQYWKYRNSLRLISKMHCNLNQYPRSCVLCVYVCMCVNWYVDFTWKNKSPKIAKAILKIHNAEELKLPNTSTILP